MLLTQLEIPLWLFTVVSPDLGAVWLAQVRPPRRACSPGERTFISPDLEWKGPRACAEKQGFGDKSAIAG